MPFLSAHSLIWLSDHEFNRASLKLWVADAAEAAAAEVYEAKLLLATRELRRIEAMSLSRDVGCGTGIPRSSAQALSSEVDQVS